MLAGVNGRVIAEDVISYSQIQLAETTTNTSIEVVKRNLRNIFEDFEDPMVLNDEDYLSPDFINRSKSSSINKIMKAGSIATVNRNNTMNFNIVDMSSGEAVAPAGP